MQDPLLKAFLDETRGNLVWRPRDLNDYEAAFEILAASRETQGLIVSQALKLVVEETEGSRNLEPLVRRLLNKSLPLSKVDLSRLLRLATNSRWDWLAVAIRTLERTDRVTIEELHEPLQVLRQAPSMEYVTAKQLKRLDSLLGKPVEEEELELHELEAWTRALVSLLDGMGRVRAEGWRRFLDHCNTATSTKPSYRWLCKAEELIEPIRPGFTGEMVRCLEQVGEPGTPESRYNSQSHPTEIHARHSDLLRGLIWSGALVAGLTLTKAIGKTATRCFEKIPNVGPRSTKIGNACLTALSYIGSEEAVSTLTRVSQTVRHKSLRKLVQVALAEAADMLETSLQEIEEAMVPDLGLTEVGSLAEQVGSFTARLTLAPKASLTWLDSDQRLRKSVPKEVKDEHSDCLKRLKALKKEGQKLLESQLLRIQSLPVLDKEWSYPRFRTCYLDHPLVGVIARDLIWNFTGRENQASGRWLEDHFVDSQGEPLDWIAESTKVRSWHPVEASREEVEAWQEHLSDFEVLQVFPQAGRKLFRPGDGCSVAGHRVHQKAFLARTQAGGWSYRLQGSWSAPSMALRDYDSGYRVEVQVEPDGSTNSSGAFEFVVLGQTRFYDLDNPHPLAPETVSPVLYSEAMFALHQFADKNYRA